MLHCNEYISVSYVVVMQAEQGAAMDRLPRRIEYLLHHVVRVPSFLNCSGESGGRCGGCERDRWSAAICRGRPCGSPGHCSANVCWLWRSSASA